LDESELFLRECCLKSILIVFIFLSTSAFAYESRVLRNGERPDCSLPFLLTCNNGQEFGVSCNCNQSADQGCGNFCAQTCAPYGGMVTYNVDPVEEYRYGDSQQKCDTKKDESVPKTEPESAPKTESESAPKTESESAPKTEP
jgi:hypothetical protein